eukprot:tig00020943_g16251.t1
MECAFRQLWGAHSLARFRWCLAGLALAIALHMVRLQNLGVPLGDPASLATIASSALAALAFALSFVPPLARFCRTRSWRCHIFSLVLTAVTCAFIARVPHHSSPLELSNFVIVMVYLLVAALNVPLRITLPYLALITGALLAVHLAEPGPRPFFLAAILLGIVLALICAYITEEQARRTFLLSRIVENARASAERANTRSALILQNLLPADIAAELKRNDVASINRWHESVSVAFLALCEEEGGGRGRGGARGGEEGGGRWNAAMAALEALAEAHGVQKIKTVGPTSSWPAPPRPEPRHAPLQPDDAPGAGRGAGGGGALGARRGGPASGPPDEEAPGDSLHTGPASVRSLASLQRLRFASQRPPGSLRAQRPSASSEGSSSRSGPARGAGSASGLGSRLGAPPLLAPPAPSASEPSPDRSHPRRLAAFACAAAAAAAAGSCGGLRVRAGLHVGPLVSGILGSRLFFDVFGDAVNVAQRMCVTAEPGCVQASAAFREALLTACGPAPGGPPFCKLSPERTVHVKGKGPMATCVLVPRAAAHDREGCAPRLSSGSVSAGASAGAPAMSEMEPRPSAPAGAAPPQRRPEPAAEPWVQRRLARLLFRGDVVPLASPGPPAAASVTAAASAPSSAAASAPSSAGASADSSPRGFSHSNLGFSDLESAAAAGDSFSGLRAAAPLPRPPPGSPSGADRRRVRRLSSVAHRVLRRASASSRPGPRLHDDPSDTESAWRGEQHELADLAPRRGASRLAGPAPFADPAREADFWAKRRADAWPSRALLLGMACVTVAFPLVQLGVKAPLILDRVFARCGLPLPALLAAFGLSWRPLFAGRHRLVAHAVLLPFVALLGLYWIHDVVLDVNALVKSVSNGDATVAFIFVNNAFALRWIEILPYNALLFALSFANMILPWSASPTVHLATAIACAAAAHARELDARKGYVLDAQAIHETERLLEDAEDTRRLLSLCVPASVLSTLVPTEDDSLAPSDGGIDRLLRGAAASAASAFPRVVAVCADVVGFTALAGSVEPAALVRALDEAFSRCDSIGRRHGLETLKTVGDCWIGVAGLSREGAGPAEVYGALCAAREMPGVYAAVPVRSGPAATAPAAAPAASGGLRVRIGVAVGSAAGAIVGAGRWQYDLFGDAVNEALEMEERSSAGRVRVSAAAAELAMAYPGRGPLALEAAGADPADPGGCSPPSFFLAA